MFDASDPALTRLLKEHRSEPALRRESLGPLAEAAGILRDSCVADRRLLDEIDVGVSIHLGLLDAVTRSRSPEPLVEAPRPPAVAVDLQPMAEEVRDGFC